MSHELLGDPCLAQLARLKPVLPPAPGDLVRLPLVRKAFIYQRLSTHDPRKKSLWVLGNAGRGARAGQGRWLPRRSDHRRASRPRHGGTKGRKERPGLAALIQAIEADAVEAVYVVHISRISRDQTLIDGLEFGERANSTACSSPCPPCASTCVTPCICGSTARKSSALPMSLSC
jgi:hypothetical protein